MFAQPIIAMRHLVAALALLIGTALSAEFDPYKGSAPVLVLMTNDPWAQVIGSDTPRLVAYDDGTIIYQREQNKISGLWVAHLTPDGLSKLVNVARPLLQLPGLQRHYNLAPGVTDQPTTTLFVSDKDVTKVVGVYGLTSQGRSFHEHLKGEEPPPPEFMKVHKSLCDYLVPDAKPWVPPYIEIMLWDYNYAPDTSIIWPSKWPKLDSPRARKRGHSFSIYLDGTELRPLRDFAATRKEKGAVEISGRKFALDYRCTFPSEPIWMAAFSKR